MLLDKGDVKRILVCREVCSGCRACEVACVSHHEGVFGTATARIHVSKVESEGIAHPHVCRQCRRAPCITACPTSALYRDERTQAVLVREADCIGCSACVDACPFGMAAIHPSTGVALICDLCGGNPACVARCATGAIRYTRTGAQAEAKRKQAVVSAERTLE